MPLTSPRLGTPAVRLFLLSFLFFLFVSASPGVASAEKIIAKGDDWQVFTDGRVGGFVSYVHGDGFPVTTEGTSPTGDQVDIQKPLGGGWVAADSRGKTQGQGTIDSMRVRSGFIGNTLGIGVRGQVTPYTMVTGYIQFWADIESLSRQKSQPNVVDARQGYAKLEGWWGSFLAGRTRTLFSRGATDIDVLYGQRWGIGFPGNIDSNGFGSGHVGFGVMGSSRAISTGLTVEAWPLSTNAVEKVEPLIVYLLPDLGAERLELARNLEAGRHEHGGISPRKLG